MTWARGWTALAWIAALSLTASLPAGRANAEDGADEAAGADETDETDGEADAPAEPARKPFRFEIASPDGHYRMRLSLVGQLWVVADDRWRSDEAVDHEIGATVAFRRIRVALGGNVFTPALRYKLQLSLLPGDFEMMDLYADYAFTHDVHARLGVWKIPFTRLRTRSFTHRQLVDWPIVSEYLGAERQLGFALHNGYDDATPPPVEWAVGVFTGVNWRSSHALGPQRLFSTDEPLQGRPLHPELVARVGYNHGGIDTRAEGDLEGCVPVGQGRPGTPGGPRGGPFRFATHLSAAWDLAPVWGQDWALRVALEWLMKVAGYSLTVGGYLATVQVGETPAEQAPGAAGLFVATGLTLGKRIELAAEYALVDPLDRPVDTVHEVRGGINVFIVDRQVMWRTDAGALITELGSGVQSTELQVRSLVQLAL